jgi:predicted HTH domain antitoxin
VGDDALNRTLTIEYGDDVLLALRLSPEQFTEEVKLLVAVKLYELGRLSSGAAARLAGIPKPLFLTKLADYGVDTFRVTEEELRQDLATARRHQ